MEVQTEPKKTKKEKTKKNKRVTLNEGKINLVLYTVGGGIVGSALFAATTYGAQTVTNISTLIGGLGGGVISGFLTLQGVKRAIDLQKEKEREESKPQKVLSLHLMIKLTERYKFRISMLEGVINSIPESGHKRLKSMLEYLDKEKTAIDFDYFSDKMIEESLRIDRDIYFPIKENLDRIRSYDILLDSCISFTAETRTKEELQEDVTKYIGIILKKVKEIEALLERELDVYEQSLFSRKS
ncbi:hypothetical protein CN556_10245 [Bacillus wiedmannii]|uniref:hypothetical protein n=1 Tax=Bacillus cereus group TaxID=86661 RepID=UPI000BEBE5A8|nr:hypothetical protein [Bacillus wiedmannii]PEC58557.1 hypothetical protein CON91_27110 [Bacillus wiedmannii]PEI39430.1 hypothetical protein CN644_01775 [Bacillus wiedmannii]PEN96785.1 hypothetical protein CN556_10245 [Bacillus wiedmannii]